MEFKTIEERISNEVSSNPIILYVKGSPGMPQCGFSKGVMDIFQKMGVPFETRNVLDDPELREGIKRFTSWPTIPQVFIQGEFIGGYDIIREMYQKGELEKKLAEITRPQDGPYP